MRGVVTLSEYRALRGALARLGSTGAYWRTGSTIGRALDAEPVQVAVATHSLLPALGIRPMLGRLPPESEDSIGAVRVAVIGYGLWRRRFGSASSALGATLLLADEPYTVIGVLPRGFVGVDATPVDLWLPLGAGAPDLFGDAFSVGSNAWLTALVKGNAQASSSTVEAVAAATLQRETDDDGVRVRVRLGPLQEARGPLADPNVKVLLWAAALSALVFLIACANVSNLLLARAAGRGRELAIKRALGAQPHHIAGEIAIEGLCLAMLGGAAALCAAIVMGPSIQALLLPVGSVRDPALTKRLVLLVVTLAVAGGLGSALWPGLRMSRASLTNLLADRNPRGRGGRAASMRGLILGQVTLTLALLVAAGLFLRSLRNVLRIDLGVDPRNVFTVTLEPGRAEGDRFNNILARFERLLDVVRTQPQVTRAALSIGSPFGQAMAASVSLPGHAPPPGAGGARPDVQFFTVTTPEFFEVMGMEIVRGRGFLPSDIDGAPPVAVINQMLAKALWQGDDPTGRCFQIMGGAACTTVVGVVNDAPFLSVTGAPRPFFYRPLAQAAIPIPLVTLEVRTNGHIAGTAASLRREMAAAEPDMPYADVAPLSDRIDPQLRPWRLGSLLFSTYGALALVLTGSGLYGLLAYNVRQRHREIGIRIALGAEPRMLLLGVIRDALAWTILGIGAGAIGACAVARAIRALLYGTGPYDWRVFAGAALTLVAVALLASAIPGRRATMVDPQIALRTE